MLITEEIDDSAFLQISLSPWLPGASKEKESQQSQAFGLIPSSPKSASPPGYPLVNRLSSLQHPYSLSSFLPTPPPKLLSKWWPPCGCIQWSILGHHTGPPSSLNAVDHSILLITLPSVGSTSLGSYFTSLDPLLALPLLPTSESWIGSVIDLISIHALHNLIQCLWF